MPLLYTMEMWQHGITVSEWHVVAMLGVMLLVNFLFSLLSGFREEYSVSEAISEAICGSGLALMISASILWLIGELPSHEHLVNAVGKIVLTAVAVSIGISFANAQFRKSRTEDREDESDDGEAPSDRRTAPSAEERQLRDDLKDLAAAVTGATVFSLNVAPTEEILMIATRLSPLQLLLLLAVSVGLCYLILFAAEFRERRVHVRSVFQQPFSETLLTCGVSLLVAALLLTLLGHRGVTHSPEALAASIVTLGLPAIVGGAAGRIIA